MQPNALKQTAFHAANPMIFRRKIHTLKSNCQFVRHMSGKAIAGVSLVRVDWRDRSTERGVPGGEGDVAYSIVVVSLRTKAVCTEQPSDGSQVQ
jgi:hypothetical protein